MLENTAAVGSIIQDRPALLAGVQPGQAEAAGRIVDDMEEVNGPG